MNRSHLNDFGTYQRTLARIDRLSPDTEPP